MSHYQLKKNIALLRIIIPICSIIICVAVFDYAAGSFAAASDSRQQEALEEAVRSAAVYCYSLEGEYPEDVAYLEKNYALTYDKEAFYVGYRLQGANLLPEITVIPLKEQP